MITAVLVTSALAFSAPGSRVASSRVGGVCMRTASEIAADFSVPLAADDLAIIGLATAYMTSEKGKPVEVAIVEPLPSGTVETICSGIETSYRRTYALLWGDLVEGDLNAPSGVNMAALEPLLQGEEVQALPENWLDRAVAAFRTVKRRREECEKLVPLGTVCTDYNHDTSVKRILDQEYEPNESDNVKQDMSIDVYGRNDDASAAEIERLANM